MNIDLRQIRENINNNRKSLNPSDKGISQEDIANGLAQMGHEISQAQVSRYEANPSSITMELLIPWLSCLGTTIAEAVTVVDRTPSGSIDVGAPYENLQFRLKKLDEYFDTRPESVEATLSEDDVKAAVDFKALVRSLNRKPNIVLAGKFDAGKTTMANWLLGREKSLAESYSPTTNVVTFIHHIHDRPLDWPKEDVWLFGKGWNHHYWRTEEHRDHHLITSGGLGTLRTYGTHQGEKGDSDARFAMVFLDSAILRSCNLIDLPGYSHDEIDSEMANASAREMDALVYLSSTNGFFDSADAELFRFLIRQLPILPHQDGSVDPLSNLWLVSTHAHMGIQAEDIRHMPKAAANRIFRQMGEHELLERGEEARRAISEADIARRIFPFYRESASRCAPFRNSLQRYLGADLPATWASKANEAVDSFKKLAEHTFASQIERTEKLIESISSARKILDQINNNERDRKRKQDDAIARVHDSIDQLKAENLGGLGEIFEEVMDVEYIEMMINAKYGKDKKAAQQEIPGYIKGVIEHCLRDRTKEATEKLKASAEGFLADLEGSLRIDEQNPESQLIPFDAKGAFAGGLASAATVGGLAIWAGTFGNLAGYAAAATALGWFNVGGAAWMSGIAAIGGPATLAVGLGVGAFFLARSLFGDNWKRRLAKQVHKQFTSPERGAPLKSILVGTVNQHWSDAKNSFDNAVTSYENKFAQHVAEIKALAESEMTKEELESRICRFELARDFLVQLPWSPQT